MSKSEDDGKMKIKRALFAGVLLFALSSQNRASFGQQTQTARPQMPGPEKGYLVLQGGGASIPEIFERFVALAGGKNARLVLIPTATAFSFPDRVIPEERLKQMKTSMEQRMGVPQITLLHTMDRQVADSEKFVEPLADATGVWVLGGDEGILASVYKGTRTERELDAVVARGGVVGGTSAGADIWAPYIFDLPPDMEKVPLNNMGPYLKPEGFGLLREVVILPHFTERHLEVATPKILDLHPDVQVIGIDEGTAIFVHGDSFEVVGREGVSVSGGKAYAGKGNLLLKNGDRFDLTRRAVIGAASR